MEFQNLPGIQIQKNLPQICRATSPEDYKCFKFVAIVNMQTVMTIWKNFPKQKSKTSSTFKRFLASMKTDSCRKKNGREVISLVK